MNDNVPQQPAFRQTEPPAPPVAGGYAPAPDYTAAPGALPTARYAEWPHRACASLIDAALVLAFSLVGAILGQLSFFFSIIFGMAGFAVALWLAYLNGSRGQSPGKALMGLRVVREDGTLLGGPMGVVRTLTLGALGAVTLGFGSLVAVLWPLWDEPKRQALHDKIFGTVVLTGAPRKPIGQELFLP